MSASLEARNRSQAYMITAGFAGLMILIMLLVKWKLPVFERTADIPGIEVELNLPPDPPLPETPDDGGGGGGNPVQATGPAGIAQAAPIPPGTEDNSRDIEDDNDKANPEVTKPIVVKPKAVTVTNTSVTKVPEPKVVENPAPPRPKAVLGKTTTGAGKGGGAAEDYDRSGGRGTGTGVGNGSGVGGGNGSGVGGGNGSGTGGGSGPKVTRGDRKIVRSYSFQGDLDKAVIYANINVSPEGTGTFVSIAKGSSTSSGAYKDAIVQYLRNIRFDKSDHESMVTVQFNFRVN
jgi:hypothetical protein